MIVIGSVLVIGAFLVLWWGVSAPKPLNLAEDNLKSGPTVDAREVALQSSSSDRIVAPAVDFLATQAKKFTSRGLTERIARQLQLGGLANTFSVDQILAIRLVLMIVGVVFAVVLISTERSTSRLAMAILILLVTYLLPKASLARRADERQRQIQLSVPDVLDQITVSVEAGLGFDSALSRAAINGRGPFAEELNRVLQDIQVGRSREQALDSLIKRTDVDDLRKFVFAVRQAERYGLPVANVLRVQAKDARERRRSDAEERAQQLPVKLVFPLVLCILPALFVVVLGPASLTIFDNF